MPKLFVVIACLIASFATSAGTVSYCQDKRANQDWKRLTSEYSEISELKTLHNLRKSLCEQVETGELDLSDAIDLFEMKRIKVLKQLRKRFDRDLEVDTTVSG